MLLSFLCSIDETGSSSEACRASGHSQPCSSYLGAEEIRIKNKGPALRSSLPVIIIYRTLKPEPSVPTLNPMLPFRFSFPFRPLLLPVAPSHRSIL